MGVIINILLRYVQQSIQKLSLGVNKTLANSPTYFVSKSSCPELKNIPGLRFKSGGWIQENNQWGLIWSASNTRDISKVLGNNQGRHVKVVTKSGESVVAVAL